jgi:flagellin-like hook-associated protein FlgL
MAKLDPKNFKMALREAARMREANEDPYFLATSLLNQNFRLRQLESVANLAEQILQSGATDELLEQIQEALQAIRGEAKKAA